MSKISFNPRLPGGRRLEDEDEEGDDGDVSIHAFRGEGDLNVVTDVIARRRFQSTPSGGKATQPAPGQSAEHRTFQSTPSGGKATIRNLRPAKRRIGFNPRLPGGRRLGTRSRFPWTLVFQSTPSGGKATCATVTIPRYAPMFQSTPSGGKATVPVVRTHLCRFVSIHAFRGEGDKASA